MFKIEGKYNTAIVYADENNKDHGAIGQIKALCNMDEFKNSKIRIMPDYHSGEGCVIGTAMTITDKIIPSLIGPDIGCGITSYIVKLNSKLTNKDLEGLDNMIRKEVPYGFSIHEKSDYKFSKYNHSPVNILNIKAPIDTDKAIRSLGTLGGGNHFIEVEEIPAGIFNEENLYHITSHTGSRGLGMDIFKYYQDLAYENMKKKYKGDIKQLRKDLIAKLESEGRQKELSKELKKLNDEYKKTSVPIPYELAYLEGEDMKNYIHDINIAQEYAYANRSIIILKIIAHLASIYNDIDFAYFNGSIFLNDKIKTKNGILHPMIYDIPHNYLVKNEYFEYVLHKGSICAVEYNYTTHGSVFYPSSIPVIIPLNMKDGIMVCEIKDTNEAYNMSDERLNSLPHGAGRKLSRKEAKESISINDYKESMDGIYSSTVNKNTIDESVFAYKDSDYIIDELKDMVDILYIAKPIYNFKSDDQDADSYRRINYGKRKNT